MGSREVGARRGAARRRVGFRHRGAAFRQPDMVSSERSVQTDSGHSDRAALDPQTTHCCRSRRRIWHREAVVGSTLSTPAPEETDGPAGALGGVNAGLGGRQARPAQSGVGACATHIGRFKPLADFDWASARAATSCWSPQRRWQDHVRRHHGGQPVGRTGCAGSTGGCTALRWRTSTVPRTEPRGR